MSSDLLYFQGAYTEGTRWKTLRNRFDQQQKMRDALGWWRFRRRTPILTLCVVRTINYVSMFQLRPCAISLALLALAVAAPAVGANPGAASPESFFALV